MRPLFCAGCLLYCHRYQKSWAHGTKNSGVSAPGRAHGVKTSEARGTRLLIIVFSSTCLHATLHLVHHSFPREGLISIYPLSLVSTVVCSFCPPHSLSLILSHCLSFADGSEASRAGIHAYSPPPSLCGDQVGNGVAKVSRWRVRGSLWRGQI
jgi:hypothetical protein